MKRKIANAIIDAIPFIVYFGGPYIAFKLTGIIDRIILAIIWGAYIFTHYSYTEQNRGLKRVKQNLYSIEKSHHNQTKRLKVAEGLLSEEQKATFWTETALTEFSVYEYQEFDPYEYDQNRREKGLK